MSKKRSVDDTFLIELSFDLAFNTSDNLSTFVNDLSDVIRNISINNLLEIFGNVSVNFSDIDVTLGVTCPHGHVRSTNSYSCGIEIIMYFVIFKYTERISYTFLALTLT